MRKSAAKLKSYYSSDAGVSLVLPADWIEQRYPSFSALYRSTALSQHNPHLGINRFKINDPQPNMQHTAAENAVNRNLLDYEDVDFSDTEVDNHPASIHTFRWRDKELNLLVLQRFVFVQLGDEHIIQVVCSAHQTQWLRYRQVFEQAVDSMRFLLY